jgi:hypothetical protein
MVKRLIYVTEPRLRFGYGQALEDPRDGLTLFGPLDRGGVYGVRGGVIGTAEGIRRFEKWVRVIQAPISDAESEAQALFRPFFPGFETVFGIPWSPTPQLQIGVDPVELNNCLHIADRHQRVYKTVDLFAKQILNAKRQEEQQIDVWFVVIPDDVHKYCRPKSVVEASLRQQEDLAVSSAEAKRFLKDPSLFAALNEAVETHRYEPDFHNQLKARLLLSEAPLQVIQESTLAPEDFLTPLGRPRRRVDKPSTVAWNVCSTAFYKASGRPWKLHYIRKGVCYLGLVFKRDDREGDTKKACCAAQMFLDSGDGVVFKGAVGPWYSPDNREYHLSGSSARDVVALALETYAKRSEDGKPPRELFIHGRIRFNDEEWEGFTSACTSATRLVGVRIRRATHLKLFSRGDYPIARGLAYLQSHRDAYLWTVGFIPRLQTYIGKEVPNPIFVEICRGEASIVRVLSDVLALTKLNYNACVFGDGEPVTLKFADAVGEILTAAPLSAATPPLPFKYYI